MKKTPRGGMFGMKKLVVIIVFMHVVGLVGLLPAQEPKGPKIIVREVQYDFGKVVQGTMASHVFEIRNGGNEPLDIERIAPS
jgi:hypothetical protein